MQAQNASVENVEHYLNLFENDMKMRFDAMKMQFEKISEHFAQNVKLMRKELLRYSSTKSFFKFFSFYLKFILNIWF